MMVKAKDKRLKVKGRRRDWRKTMKKTQNEYLYSLDLFSVKILVFPWLIFYSEKPDTIAFEKESNLIPQIIG